MSSKAKKNLITSSQFATSTEEVVVPDTTSLEIIINRPVKNVISTSHISTDEIEHRNIVNVVPIGALHQYAALVSTESYLLCDGAVISRATYVRLFAVIGTTYGVGDGTTTFAIPDLRSRVPIGRNNTFTLASTGGSLTKTLSIGELPAHTHTGTTTSDGAHTHSITDPGHTHNQLNGKDDGNLSNMPGQAPIGDSSINLVTGYPTSSSTTGISMASGGAHTHTFTTSSVGSGTSFSLMNPYISLSYIIRYQ
jgi:microcystin-dependent protein